MDNKSTSSAQDQDLVSDKSNENENLTKDQVKYKNDLIKYKQEALELRNKLKEIELSEEQKKGNYSEVISKLKEDLNATKRESMKMKANFAQARLEEAIKTTAMAKGLKGTQVDLFVKAIDENSKMAVEFDDSFNVRKDDIENIVDEHLKRYSDVFKTKINVVDGVPNNRPMGVPEKRFDIKTASVNDIVAQLKSGKY